jgi:4-diphosphocytidyl-2-C-methyl-D-erythritol kinase
LPLPGPDFPAPAKLNLFLHVVGRRADGYHLLQSVFTLIDRADRLRFRVRRDGVVARANDVAGVPEQEDLTVRAALLLREASGTPLGADIEVEKHIPMGAGLGGGSSDAATTLIVLDRLWETGFGPEALAELASALGADIPFFLHGGAAWAEGTGDELRAIDLPPRWYVVLTPPVQVPTKEVFAAPELTRNTEPLKIEDFSARGGEGRFHNDLERVVTARYPVVRSHLEWLAARGEARMTGSGACVFAPYGSREAAQRVLDQLPAGMSGFVAQGLERHPLRVQ